MPYRILGRRTGGALDVDWRALLRKVGHLGEEAVLGRDVGHVALRRAVGDRLVPAGLVVDDVRLQKERCGWPIKCELFCGDTDIKG